MALRDRAKGTQTTRDNESPFEDSNEVSDHGGNMSDSESDLESETDEKPQKSKRPKENNFSQQRLKAVNPVFTARTVIPILILAGVILVPLGVAMWLASHRVEDFLIEYSQCENEALLNYWSKVPDEYISYNFRNSLVALEALWKLSTDETQQYDDEKNVCMIQFTVPTTMKGPLYFFYRLKNFHQNHRRYVKSFSEDQLDGKAASTSSIKDTVGLNCQPLSLADDGKKYYPCGLIANSLFNDTYTLTFTAVNGTSTNYTMTNKGIAWATNKNRYKKTKYNYTEIAPPPNWIKKFPDGYNSTNVPDILTWEEFQNWMYTSAFPDFYKMALRNDNDALEAGTYEISIGLHFPVLPYDGHKYVFVSQRSVLGGRNFFLGYSWIASGGVCILLGLALLVVTMVKPRRAGDVNLLSWNREAMNADSS